MLTRYLYVCRFSILLTATGVMFVASLVLTIVMYVFFAHDQTHCGKNTAFITLNIIFCFLISIVSIAPKVYVLTNEFYTLSPLCARVIYSLFFCIDA